METKAHLELEKEIVTLRDPWGKCYSVSMDDLIAHAGNLTAYLADEFGSAASWATPTQLRRQTGKGMETAAALGQANRFWAYVQLRARGMSHEAAENAFLDLQDRQKAVREWVRRYLDTPEGVDRTREARRNSSVGGEGGTPYDGTKSAKVLFRWLWPRGYLGTVEGEAARDLGYGEDWDCLLPTGYPQPTD